MAFLNCPGKRHYRWCAVAVMWLGVVSSTRAAQPTLEYEVKAAFLYNFLNFVTWPAVAFTGPTDPVRICIFGSDPFGELLDRTMESGTAGARPVVVGRIADETSLSRCIAVFIPQAAAGRVEQVVRAVASRPVLIIGESPGFLSKGGMINFVLEGGRVRFDVNVAAASARGLNLSSRLLRVARNTIRPTTGL